MVSVKYRPFYVDTLIKEIEIQKEEIEFQKNTIEEQNKKLKKYTLHLEEEIEKKGIIKLPEKLQIRKKKLEAKK